MKIVTLLKKLKIKPLDIIVLLALCLLSFTPIFFLAKPAQAGTQAVLKHDGKVVKTFNLSKNTVYTYDNKGKICRIQVAHKKIRIIYANCFDNICRKTSWTNSPNKIIVCLPHKNVISVLPTAKHRKDNTVDYTA
ncbi:NusG domain II-containing protein [Lactococcus nasutitermitis]|uniref:NusG domain II-containing protein n=1 Tax=Lactococcus nasutitermitis TaxID=1652957 RepID=A0ABV9JC29_9LACT|nr:NusG domain II-containing protein [Lactococcus nasutitermitis]